MVNFRQDILESSLFCFSLKAGTCKNFTQISADETSGEFSSGIYEGIDCWWSFEAPVGKRIRLSVSSLDHVCNTKEKHFNPFPNDIF